MMNPFDVNDDFAITAADATAIEDDIAANGERLLPFGGPEFPPPWLDVNGDGYVTQADADQVTFYVDLLALPTPPAWMNPTNPLDVNDDGYVDSSDEQLVQNLLGGDYSFDPTTVAGVHIR